MHDKSKSAVKRRHKSGKSSAGLRLKLAELLADDGWTAV